MLAFQHVTPPLRLFSGPESLAQLGRELSRLGSRRSVVVCGRSLSQDGRLLGRVQAAMGEAYAGTIAGVRAHSPLPAVEAAARQLRELEADTVVALGGGSAVVTARAATILLAEGGDARRLATSTDGRGGLRSPKLLAPKLPQLIVPTTPNTAMVKAGTAVFDPESGERLALFDPKTRAHAIFIDPDSVMSAPVELIRSASLDTFALAAEGLISRSGNPIADALLMHSVRLLAQHLPDAIRRDDVEMRAQLMLAAVLCGQGTDHTGAGIATVLGHALGARFETDNGLVKAAVLPHALRFNAEAATGLWKLGAALGLSGEASAIAVVAEVERVLGTVRRLRELGVPLDSLPGIAQSSLGDWFLRGSPRRVQDASELQQVLEDSW